jgi:hypothetical protein
MKNILDTHSPDLRLFIVNLEDCNDQARQLISSAKPVGSGRIHNRLLNKEIKDDSTSDGIIVEFNRLNELLELDKILGYERYHSSYCPVKRVSVCLADPEAVPAWVYVNNQ